MFLKVSGIPDISPPGTVGEILFTLDGQGAWRPSAGDHSYEIEAECVHIHDSLAAAIFGGLDAYYEALPGIPEFLYVAGLNSESNLPREEFERILLGFANHHIVNKSLYLYDCRKLVSGIQECTKEIIFLQGEFFRSLNLDGLISPPIREIEGISYTTSPVVTKIHAMLGFIFIRLHSLLDYITKLAYEVENLTMNFSKYPKLSSKKIMFGDHKILRNMPA